MADGSAFYAVNITYERKTVNPNPVPLKRFFLGLRI